jgi:hypothetical protein
MSRRDGPRAAVEGLAAFAVGGLTSIVILQNLGAYLLAASASQGTGFDWLQAIPAIFAVCAALVCFAVPRWSPDGWTRAGGWTAAALGSVCALGLVYARGSAHGEARTVGAAVASGLALGGVLAVLGAGSSALAVASGLAAGLVAMPAVLWLASDWGHETGVSVVEMVRSQAVAAAALTVLAAILAVYFRGSAEPRDHALLGSVVVTAVVAGLAVAAEAVRRAVSDEVLHSATGGLSQRRMDAVETFNKAALVAIAVGAGVVLVWYAYLRGKADAARWVAVAFGVAAPIALAPRLFYLDRPGDTLVVLIVGVLAVSGGVLLTLFADQRAPWDALGVLLAAIGLLLSPISVREQLGSGRPAQLLLAAGLGVGLGAGLSRLARQRDRQVAATAALGFAAMALAGQALVPVVVVPLSRTRFGELPLTGPVVMMVTALVLVLLFGLGRMVDRIRRDIYAEAQRPE